MRGLRDWWRACTASPVSVGLSLAMLSLLGYCGFELVRWGFVDGVWHAASGNACNPDGACWAFLRQRAGLILFGPYPADQRWRVLLAGGLGLAGLAVLIAPRPRRKLRFAAWFLAIYPLTAFVLLRGGAFGLVGIDSEKWGGLMLTLVVAGWTIVTAMPLGVMLAYARRSPLPVVRAVATLYIDIMRGLPLIGVLFVGIVMFPFFMPPGLEIDKLMCAVMAFTLFNAANFAELFRGGLQAIPASQIEGAASLGLRGWEATFLVVLPQVISISLPGIVNISVSIIKETTLILIIGLFDPLAAIQAAALDPNWLTSDEVRVTGYFVTALGFWALCFGLSLYGAHVEQRMKAGMR